MISRKQYFDLINENIDTDLIKVLVGVRRSGKSTLLQQIYESIKERGVDENNIIYINFESLKFMHIRNYKELYSYIEGKIEKKDKLHYLFFDEIQEVEHFEKAINSFRVDFKVSIFITGSNSKMLSSELSTVLTGRYIKYNIYPFSFLEYKKYNKFLGKNVLLSDSELLVEFYMFGGLPQVIEQTSIISKQNYLSDLLDSIIYKDILARYKVSDIYLFRAVVAYIIDSSGNTLNITNITNYIQSSTQRSVSRETISNYIEYLMDANIITKCERYNIKGKMILARHEKIYVNDLGFRNSVKNYDNISFGSTFETLVFNYLVSKNFDVYVGKLDNLEVDFICKKNGETFYIQVCYELSNEKTIMREQKSLLKIKDAYKKIVISSEKNFNFNNGIIYINIIDLLSENTLFI